VPYLWCLSWTLAIARANPDLWGPLGVLFGTARWEEAKPSDPLEALSHAGPCPLSNRDEPWAIQATPVAANPPVYIPKCAPESVKLSGAFAQPCYQSCALVGSSGVLRNSSWGATIDEHEAVFRLNNAPVEGYKQDVGSRTTVRILWDYHLTTTNEHKLARTERDGAIFIWPPLRKPDTVRTGGPGSRVPEVSHFIEEFSARRKRACAPILRFSPEVYAEVYRVSGLLVGKFPPVVPSTGFLAVLMSLQLCRKVDVFGLSWSMSQKSSMRHRRSGDDTHSTYYFNKKGTVWNSLRSTKEDEALYYSKVGEFGMTHHDLVGEKAAFKTLMGAYDLKFL